MYRVRLRNALARAGIMSNPGVTDDWILDHIDELIIGPPPLTAETIPAPYLKLVGEKYAWEPEVARQKIARAQELLKLKTVDDAISYLAFEHIPGRSLVICDGCSVELPFEHRCHQELARVNGEHVGKPCQCAVCFVAENLLFD